MPTPEIISAVQQSIRDNDVIALQAILATGVNINEISIPWGTEGQLDVLQYWVRKHRHSGGPEICDALLQAGANPDKALALVDFSLLTDGTPSNCFYNQCIIENSLLKLKLRPIQLPRPGKALNEKLHAAIANRTLAIAEACLEAGADPYYIDETNSDGHRRYFSQSDLHGYTAMDKALYNEDVTLIQLLLRYGVDPNSKRVPPDYHRKHTPFQVSIINATSGLDTSKASIKCLEVMLLGGAKVTPADYQCMQKASAAVNELLKLAEAKQAYPDNLIRQIIAVLKQNTSSGWAGLQSQINRTLLSFWRYREMGDLISALERLAANGIDSHEPEKIGDIIKKNKDQMPENKYIFIQTFIIEPLMKAQAAATKTYAL